MIIGISGVSTSGKSTISDFLKQNLNAKVFSLDEYFAILSLPRVKLHGQEIGDWDRPDSIDWDTFFSDLSVCTDFLIIIEGFLLFSHENMHSQIDALINVEFTENDFQIALERRISRGFHSSVPDNWEQCPTANDINLSCSYFQNIVWKRALDHPEYRHPRNWNRPYLALSATADIADNCKMALSFVQKLLPSCKRCSVQ